MRTKIGRGPDGNNIVNPSDLRTMSILTDSQHQTESDSWEPLPAMAMREGRVSRQSHGPLPESTIRGAISHVSSSFRDNDRPNPTKDEDSDLGRILSRLFRAFRNKDPNPKQQKTLPAQVLIMMHERK